LGSSIVRHQFLVVRKGFLQTSEHMIGDLNPLEDLA
jgi:hypothetical protein